MIGSIINKAQKDHITAFSAQAAFFTVLSFFPFLIVVLSLMRFFPITLQDMIDLVRNYLPEQYSGHSDYKFTERKTDNHIHVSHNPDIAVVRVQRHPVHDDGSEYHS